MTDEAKALVKALRPAKEDRCHWGFTTSVQIAREAATLIETQAREIERLRGALKTAEAWLGQWARHIGDCPGIDGCTCGLTRVRYKASAALGDSHDQ